MTSRELEDISPLVHARISKQFCGACKLHLLSAFIDLLIIRTPRLHENSDCSPDAEIHAAVVSTERKLFVWSFLEVGWMGGRSRGKITRISSIFSNQCGILKARKAIRKKNINTRLPVKTND